MTAAKPRWAVHEEEEPRLARERKREESAQGECEREDHRPTAIRERHHRHTQNKPQEHPEAKNERLARGLGEQEGKRVQASAPKRCREVVWAFLYEPLQSSAYK